MIANMDPQLQTRSSNFQLPAPIIMEDGRGRLPRPTSGPGTGVYRDWNNPATFEHLQPNFGSGSIAQAKPFTNTDDNGSCNQPAAMMDATFQGEFSHTQQNDPPVSARPKTASPKLDGAAQNFHPSTGEQNTSAQPQPTINCDSMKNFNNGHPVEFGPVQAGNFPPPRQRLLHFDESVRPPYPPPNYSFGGSHLHPASFNAYPPYPPFHNGPPGPPPPPPGSDGYYGPNNPTSFDPSQSVPLLEPYFGPGPKFFPPPGFPGQYGMPLSHPSYGYARNGQVNWIPSSPMSPSKNYNSFEGDMFPGQTFNGGGYDSDMYPHQQGNMWAPDRDRFFAPPFNDGEQFRGGRVEGTIVGDELPIIQEEKPQDRVSVHLPAPIPRKHVTFELNLEANMEDFKQPLDEADIAEVEGAKPNVLEVAADKKPKVLDIVEDKIPRILEAVETEKPKPEEIIGSEKPELEKVVETEKSKFSDIVRCENLPADRADGFQEKSLAHNISNLEVMPLAESLGEPNKRKLSPKFHRGVQMPLSQKPSKKIFQIPLVLKPGNGVQMPLAQKPSRGIQMPLAQKPIRGVQTRTALKPIILDEQRLGQKIDTHIQKSFALNIDKPVQMPLAQKPNRVVVPCTQGRAKTAETVEAPLDVKSEQDIATDWIMKATPDLESKDGVKVDRMLRSNDGNLKNKSRTQRNSKANKKPKLDDVVPVKKPMDDIQPLASDNSKVADKPADNEEPAVENKPNSFKKSRAAKKAKHMKLPKCTELPSIADKKFTDEETLITDTAPGSLTATALKANEDTATVTDSLIADQSVSTEPKTVPTKPKRMLELREKHARQPHRSELQALPPDIIKKEIEPLDKLADNMGVEKPFAVGSNTLTENEEPLAHSKKNASPVINVQSLFSSKSNGAPMQTVATGLQKMIANPVQVNVALPLAPVAQKQMDFWAAGRNNKLILGPAMVNAESVTVWPLSAKSYAPSAPGPAANGNSPGYNSRSMPLRPAVNSTSGVVVRQSVNNRRAIPLNLNPQIGTPVETEAQVPDNMRIKSPTVIQTRRPIKAKPEVIPLLKVDASATVTAEVESKDDKNVEEKREEAGPAPHDKVADFEQWKAQVSKPNGPFNGRTPARPASNFAREVNKPARPDSASMSGPPPRPSSQATDGTSRSSSNGFNGLLRLHFDYVHRPPVPCTYFNSPTPVNGRGNNNFGRRPDNMQAQPWLSPPPTPPRPGYPSPLSPPLTPPSNDSPTPVDELKKASTNEKELALEQIAQLAAQKFARAKVKAEKRLRQKIRKEYEAKEMEEFGVTSRDFVAPVEYKRLHRLLGESVPRSLKQQEAFDAFGLFNLGQDFSTRLTTNADEILSKFLQVGERVTSTDATTFEDIMKTQREKVNLRLAICENYKNDTLAHSIPEDTWTNRDWEAAQQIRSSSLLLDIGEKEFRKTVLESCYALGAYRNSDLLMKVKARATEYVKLDHVQSEADRKNATEFFLMHDHKRISKQKYNKRLPVRMVFVDKRRKLWENFCVERFPLERHAQKKFTEDHLQIERFTSAFCHMTDDVTKEQFLSLLLSNWYEMQMLDVQKYGIGFKKYPAKSVQSVLNTSKDSTNQDKATRDSNLAIPFILNSEILAFLNLIGGNMLDVDHTFLEKEREALTLWKRCYDHSEDGMKWVDSDMVDVDIFLMHHQPYRAGSFLYSRKLKAKHDKMQMRKRMAQTIHRDVILRCRTTVGSLRLDYMQIGMFWRVRYGCLLLDQITDSSFVKIVETLRNSVEEESSVQGPRIVAI